jgi:hypothetical protein
MSMMVQAVQGLLTNPITMKTEPIRPVKCFTACQSVNPLLLLMILVLRKMTMSCQTKHAMHERF